MRLEKTAEWGRLTAAFLPKQQSFALWKRKMESPKKEFALPFLLWYNKPIMGKEVQR